MSTNGAVSTVRGNGFGAPPASVRAAKWETKTRTHGFWRFAARPSVLACGFLVLAVISTASFAFIVMSHSQTELVAHTLQVQKEASTVYRL